MDDKSFEDLGEDLGDSPFKLASMQDGCPPNRGLSQELWISAEEDIAAALFSPFVRALGQGVLPKTAFQAYVAEDNYFLRSFARGYEVAIASCEVTVKPQARSTAVKRNLEDLLNGVVHELALHEGYAAEWGVDLSVDRKPAPATRKYLAFVDGILAKKSESVASILSVMIPCLRLYAYLGCTLARAFNDFSYHSQVEWPNPYMEWIHTYSQASYVRLPAVAETILDELASTDSLEKLRKQYQAAMKLEVEFFAAQAYTPPLHSVNLLVVDFDDTCTAQDTTACITHTAITAAAQQQTIPAVAAEMKAAGEQKLDWLVRNYLVRRANLLEEILPEVDEDMEEFDMGWLGDFLDRLSDFDREMNTVVVDSGILSGVERGALALVGQRLEMRPGCLNLLRRAVDSGVPVSVVSVNWSAEMVQAALSQQGLPVVIAAGAGGTGVGVDGTLPPPGAVSVYANELEYFGHVSTGGIKRRCECAVDKGRIFDDLLLGAAAEGHTNSEGISIYIGDSMTDIPALIAADIGIVLGSNTLLRQVAMAAGVPMRPLVAHPLDPAGQENQTVHSSDGGPVLYEASSWAEVDAFIFGKQFKEGPSRTHSLKERTSSIGLSQALYGEGARKPPRVMSVAGSDSGAGAGIQADIKACMASGVFLSTAVTALTAQNTCGVQAIHIPPVEFLKKQMRSILNDLGTDTVKTGMLPSIECVEAVAEELESLVKIPMVVVDPVLVATSGDPLVSSGVAQAVLSRLFPLATIVTPNVHEASVLLGGRPIVDVEDMKAAAQELHAFGPQWVLLKGGHLKTLPGGKNVHSIGASTGSEPSCVAVDVLFDGKNVVELQAPYIRTENSHGTGCTFSSVIAAELAKGASVLDGVRCAKQYVWRALERSVGLHLGEGAQRPMNHGFRISDWRATMDAMAATQGAVPETPREVASGQNDSFAFPSGSPTASLTCSRIPNSVDLRVCAVTDSGMIDQSGRTLSEAVLLAADGGATVVQLREKDCAGREFTERANIALAACRSAGIPLIINDRVDVALAIQADGVHVGQDDLPAMTARRLIGPDMLLGVSVKSVEQALAAQAAGADYVGAGAVFQTGTKVSSVIGIEGLKAICEAVKIPVVAIGGMSVQNGKEVVEFSGCAGVAAISGIFGESNVVDAAREFRMAVDAAKGKR